MSPSNVKQAAVNAILALIEQSDYLQSFIATGDKEPSWDGKIYLYDDTSQSKDHLIGGVPVQVKGRTLKNLTKGNKRIFQIKTSDLENYKTSFGVIYFLIEIDRETKEKQVFYIDLFPLSFSNIEYSKKNDTVSIQFKKLNNTLELETIIHLFLEHQKRQASRNLVTAEDFKSMKVFST